MYLSQCKVLDYRTDWRHHRYSLNTQMHYTSNLLRSSYMRYPPQYKVLENKIDVIQDIIDIIDIYNCANCSLEFWHETPSIKQGTCLQNIFVIIDTDFFYNGNILVPYVLKFWHELPFAMQGGWLQNRLKTVHHRYWCHLQLQYTRYALPFTM